MMTWQGIESAPDDGKNVLITDGTRIYLVYRFGEDVWRDAWSGDGMHESVPPTHWMPLPELPK